MNKKRVIRKNKNRIIRKCKARLERSYVGANIIMEGGFFCFIYRKNADGSHKHIAVNIDKMTIEDITGKG